MRDIRVGVAQFEHRDRDPRANLAKIRELTHRAVEQGADIVSFHECCISAYTFVQPLSHAELLAVAEPVPDGPSVRQLIEIAKEFRVVVMAGLFERDARQRIYNCYVTVSPDGFLTKFRKLHTFVSSHAIDSWCFCNRSRAKRGGQAHFPGDYVRQRPDRTNHLSRIRRENEPVPGP